MNKADLIDRMADAAGISKADAGQALDAMLDGVTAALKGGDKVTLVGFGTFSVSHRAARTGRNPRTGETLQIPAMKAAKFSPGKELKDAVNS